MADSSLQAELRTLLPESHAWSGRPTAKDLLKLPGCPAVFLLVDENERPVQLLTTQQLKRVVISRLATSEEERRERADLAAIVRGLRWRPVHNTFEARWRYYQLARLLHPREYRKLASFGPAWFLSVNWDQSVPEIRTSERIWNAVGEFIGPWPSGKQAQQAADGLCDLFDLCRYPEQVRRAPAGSRCAYFDMGRCDAPCDGSAPLPDYLARVHATWRFAGGVIEPWIADATRRMKDAAASQRFEQAGVLKQQIEFARGWLRKWSPHVRPASELVALLATPVTRRKAWKLFLFRHGHLVDGPVLQDRKFAAETATWCQAELAKPEPTLDPVVRMEQTWLVAHFQQHSSAKAAIIEELPQGTVSPELEASLRDTLSQRRKKSPAVEETEDTLPESETDAN